MIVSILLAKCFNHGICLDEWVPKQLRESGAVLVHAGGFGSGSSGTPTPTVEGCGGDSAAGRRGRRPLREKVAAGVRQRVVGDADPYGRRLRRGFGDGSSGTPTPTGEGCGGGSAAGRRGRRPLREKVAAGVRQRVVGDADPYGRRLRWGFVSGASGTPTPTGEGCGGGI